MTGKHEGIVDIYAQWDANQYSISYDLNKGTGSTTPYNSGSQPESATYGVAFEVDNPGRL